MGMDPYEERLLIALLGGGVGLLALLALLLFCYRKYRVDQKGRQHQPPRPMGPMIYQPTGHRPAGGLAMMEPGMLDPSRRYDASMSFQHQQQHQQQQLHQQKYVTQQQPLLQGGYSGGNNSDSV